MNSKTLYDDDHDSVQLMPLGGGVSITVVQDGESSTAGIFRPDDIRKAIDEVAPRDQVEAPEVDAAMVERARESLRMDGWTVAESSKSLTRALRAALTPEPPRPAWLDAPAVIAWHKNDGRTEHDGRPGVKRVWSPDYRQTETWSTPSLRNVHWSELTEVEPVYPVGTVVPSEGGEDATPVTSTVPRSGMCRDDR